ncbi:MAG: hypothetical protein ACLGG7_01595 [Bacteriovoracia bacterium]
MKVSLLLFITSLFSSSALAFGLFNNLANNVASGGHLCGRVSSEHVEAFSRRLETPGTIIAGRPLRQFETILFQNSLELFRAKSACMGDYAEAVVAAEGAISELRQTMALVWLNKKKASLILKECDVIMHEIALLTTQRVGSVSGYDPQVYGAENLARRNPRVKKEYFPVCMNNRSVSALRSLVLMADRSLPVFSSRELLQLMERHRSTLILKRTQRPLRDEEILTIDLEGSGALIRFDHQKKHRLEAEIRAYLEAKVSQRRDFVAKIKTPNFNRSLMQELYDDGSVDEALLRAGVGSTVLARDPDLNRMVSCMRADYDTSLVGSSLDFIAMFALTRSGLSRVGKLKNAPALLTDALAASVAGAPALLRACLSKNKIRDHFSGLSRNHTLALHKSHLPRGLDVDLYALEAVTLSEVPACAQMQYDHIFLDQSRATSCVAEAVYSVLPAGLGLSFALGQVILED